MPEPFKIDIHHVIDNDSSLFFGGERGYITNIVNQINGSEEDILLSLNTPGGYVFDGYPIFGAIDDFNGSITARVDGEAASMGAYIMAYADRAEARDFSRIMIHKAYNPFMEWLEDDQKAEVQKELDEINRKMSNALKNRGMDKPLVDEIFSKENTKNYWFSAREAKKVGLIDKVIKSEKHQRPKSMALNENELNKLTSKFGFWNKENYIYNKNGEDMGIFTKEIEEKVDANTNDIKDLKQKAESSENLTNDEDLLKIVDSAVGSKLEVLETSTDAKFKEIISTIERLDESGKSVNITFDEKLVSLMEDVSTKIDEIVGKYDEIKADYNALVTQLKATNNGFEVPEQNTVESNAVKTVNHAQITRDMKRELNLEASKKDKTLRN